MNFHILTLVPEMVMNGLNTSIIGRAINNGLLTIEAVNIRDFAENKHNRVDDYTYGGGHSTMAACQLEDVSFNEALEKLKGAIDKYYEEK